MNPAIPFAFIMLLSTVARAEPDFKLDGYIALGAESDPTGKVEDLFKLRLDLKTKRENGIRIKIELKADEDSRDLSVQDAYVDYRSEDEITNIRGGRGEKTIGWEIEDPQRNRMSIRHSLAYRFLNDRLIIGKDYFLSYERDLETRRLGFSLHYDESKNTALVLNAILKPDPGWRFGIWTTLLGMRNQFRKTNHLELALSGEYRSELHRVELELFGGGDPFRTEIERFYGDGRRVRFAIIKTGYGLYFGKWNPYLIATLLWKDLDHDGDKTTEGILGLRFFLTDALDLAGEYRRTVNTSDFDPSTLPYHADTGAFLARYYF